MIDAGSAVKSKNVINQAREDEQGSAIAGPTRAAQAVGAIEHGSAIDDGVFADR